MAAYTIGWRYQVYNAHGDKVGYPHKYRQTADEYLAHLGSGSIKPIKVKQYSNGDYAPVKTVKAKK